MPYRKLVRHVDGPQSGRVVLFDFESEDAAKQHDHAFVSMPDPIGIYRFGWDATSGPCQDDLPLGPGWPDKEAILRLCGGRFNTRMPGRYEVWWWTGIAAYYAELRANS